MISKERKIQLDNEAYDIADSYAREEELEYVIGTLNFWLKDREEQKKEMFNMKYRGSKQKEVYDILFNNITSSYYVEIEDMEDTSNYIDVWLGRKDYCVKIYLFGIEKTDNYIDIIKDSIYDSIRDYEEDYVDEGDRIIL